MVRGLSALLGAYALALAYLLVAPHLPAPSDIDGAALAAGAAGLVAFGLCALALTPAYDEPVPLVLVAFGAGMITAVLTATDARTAEDLCKVAAASALGLLLAWALRSMPAVVIAVPVFVAAIDLWSVLSGPTSQLLRTEPETLDHLSFVLPAWKGGLGAAQLGVSDIVFLSFFAGCAWRYGLRRRITAVLLLVSLVATLAVGIWADRAVPALPGLALALLLPNLDLLPGVLRSEPRR